MQRLNKQLVKDLIEKQSRICDLNAQVLSNLRKADVREPTSAHEPSESGGEIADQDASEHDRELSATEVDDKNTAQPTGLHGSLTSTKTQKKTRAARRKQPRSACDSPSPHKPSVASENSSASSDHKDSPRKKARMKDPIRITCSKSRPVRPMSLIREFANQIKVDTAAEEVFRRLSLRDRYMVARGGQLSGKNHAAVLMGRVSDVDTYHHRANQLPLDTHMNLSRYCVEFRREDEAGTLPKNL